MIYIMQSNKAIEPIRIFKSNREFQECAKYWKKKLFLESWFVKFELVNKHIEQDGVPADGYCQFIVQNKEASIVISNLPREDIITTFSAELTLIHELLHLKKEYLPGDYITGAGTDMLDILIHQSQEVMAKTLFMTKYNLDSEWFTK